MILELDTVRTGMLHIPAAEIRHILEMQPSSNS